MTELTKKTKYTDSISRFKITKTQINQRYRSVFKVQEKVLFGVICLIWVVTFFQFFNIWFLEHPENLSNWIFYFLSFPVLWLLFLWAYILLMAILQTENLNNNVAVGRIAMITTKTPGEPIGLLQGTLRSLLSQDYGGVYDVWLADEDPKDEMVSWCLKHNVKISTRKGNSNYYNSVYPRKGYAKEGNLAYFYDHYGYKDYDFVMQFDSDHAPDKNYLREIMREFHDESVGYVAAPSLTDANLEASWTVGARCDWESATHGIAQRGSRDIFQPVSFGSHYAIRTVALQSVGGIGPELAEDHTTSLFMQAAGWRGGFAGNATCHGFGAVGIAETMYQEYQWVVSMVRVFLIWMPKVLLKLRFLTALQFLFWQLWYPLISLMTLISLIVPIIIVEFNLKNIEISSQGFYSTYLLLNFIGVVALLYLRSLGHLRPQNAWQFNYKTVLLQIMQIPWIIYGAFVGLISVIFRIVPKKLKVTDKGNQNIRPLALVWLLPHIGISGVCSLVILTKPNLLSINSIGWFIIFNACLYCLVSIFSVILTIYENSKILDKQQILAYTWKYKWTIILTAINLILLLLGLLRITIHF